MNRSRIAVPVRQRFRPAIALAVVLAAATTLTASGGHSGCNCNPGLGDAQLVEWDLPSVADTSSGAITVDVHASHHGKLWFVSRVGLVKLYQFNPGNPAPRKTATWQSWELNPAAFTTGGLFRIKVHKDDREVFVRTDTTLQSINTGACTTDLMLVEHCERITWFDQTTDQVPDLTPHVSDLSSDDCNIYTTTGFSDPSATPAPELSYLQQLTKCRVDSRDGDTGSTTVKRWKIGGGAGFCQTALDSQPCISGVSVDPHREYLVYFSQPASNQIGELDVRTNNVRRWTLSGLGADVFEPRQLDVDWDGTVWAVTGSGHVVRLDPRRNRMSRHLMPSGISADPFGVAPDHGAIGYTNSSMSENKVAMLFPKGGTVYVGPSTECIQPEHVPVDFVVEEARVDAGISQPVSKTVHAQITDKADGTFIEARLDEALESPSMIPLGITADLSHKVGTYFYAVGLASSGSNRVGQVVLPTKHQKHGHARDDDDHDRDGKRDDEDDDDDDDGKKDYEDDDDDNDCVNDNDDDDDDNDGIKDRDDDKGKKERRDTREEEIAGGQASEFDTAIDSSNLILAATVTSLDPSALIQVAIYNPSGQLIASPPATPGVALITVPATTAGSYRIRVKNLGLSTTQMATEVLTRGTWPVSVPTILQ